MLMLFYLFVECHLQQQQQATAIFISIFKNKTHINYLIMNKNEQKLFCKHLRK